MHRNDKDLRTEKDETKSNATTTRLLQASFSFNGETILLRHGKTGRLSSERATESRCEGLPSKVLISHSQMSH